MKNSLRMKDLLEMERALNRADRSVGDGPPSSDCVKEIGCRHLGLIHLELGCVIQWRWEISGIIGL